MGQFQNHPPKDLMKQVLLISDTPRVQQVFESLEAQGILQLKTALTLNQADLQIAAAPPQVAFVQGRISGFSRDIIVRHLKKVLPKDAAIVLLAGTLEEMEQAFQHQEPYLDLALDDEALAVLARQVLEGSYQLQRPVAPAPPAAPEPAEVKPAAGPAEAAPEAQRPEAIQPPPETVQAEPETPRATTAEAQPAVEAPPAEQTSAPEPEPLLQSQFVPQFEPFTESQPVQPSGQSAEKSAQIASFAALMDEARKGAGTPEGGVNIEERIVLGASHQKGPDAAAEAKQPQREPGTGEFLVGEPLADALRRAKKKKRPLWIPVALVLALICVPLFSYLAGKKVAPNESALAPLSSARPGKEKKKSAPAPAPAPKVAEAPAPAVIPASAPAPTPAPAPAPKPQSAAPAPVVKAQGAPEAKPQPAAAPPAAPAASAAAGQKALPSLLGQTKPDPEYAKSHPGWQRYLGTSAEYKVFKEGERYKALQVLTLHGETLPEQLLTRALREFGGTEKYRLGAAAAKGKYLVQQGDASGGVAITVYRNKSHNLKAFVIYYR